MKTVMRNEYRDAAAEKKRIQNREAKPDLMNVPEIEDVYHQSHFILDNEKYPCLIASDWFMMLCWNFQNTERNVDFGVLVWIWRSGNRSVLSRHASHHLQLETKSIYSNPQIL